MRIRAELAGDAAAIDAVTQAAFRDVPYSAQSEHRIVAALRAAGALSLSLVAEVGGEVVGHVAVSPVMLSGGESGWFGLGPISVLPRWQGQGVGSALMRAALQALRAQDAAGCVLLGDPAFYQRFGFVADAGLRYPDVPAEFFQALAFRGTVPQGVVAYHAAFLV